MSYTEVDICNRALSRLGCNTVSSPTGLVKDIVENSLEAKVCRSFYEQIRDSVLEARVWSFALHQDIVAPAPDAALPHGGAFIFETVKGRKGIQGWQVYALPDGSGTLADGNRYGDNGVWLQLDGETEAAETDDGAYYAYAAATHAVCAVNAVGIRDYRLSFEVDVGYSFGKLAVGVVRGVFDPGAPPTDFADNPARGLYAKRGYDSGHDSESA